MSAVKFKFSGDSSELLKELENIKEKIRETSGQAANMRVAKGGKADVEGLGASFKKLLPAITAAGAAAAGFGAAWSAVKTGINDAMDDEYMAVQLSSYTKNIESARDLQSQLDHLAANGVVSLDDLGKAAQNLAMHFRTNNTAIMSWSEVFADIAASGKISAEQLSNSWAKVMANGFADSRAINQLQNQGIPIIKALAEEMGVAERQVVELAKKREISADQYVNAMKRMRDAEFSGKNSALSNTTIGSWETLKATFENAMGDLVSDNVSKTAGLFQYLTSRIEEASEVGFRFYAMNQENLSLFEIMLSRVQAGFAGLTGIFVNGKWENPYQEGTYDQRKNLIDYGSSDKIREEISKAKSNDEIELVQERLGKEWDDLIKQRGIRQNYIANDGVNSAEAKAEIEAIDRMIAARQELLEEIEEGVLWRENEKQSIKEIVENNQKEARAAADLNDAMEKLNETRDKANKQKPKKKQDDLSVDGLKKQLEDELAAVQHISLDDLEEELKLLEKEFQAGALDFNAATRYEKLLSVADSIREINAQLNKKNRAVNDLRQDAQEEIAIMQAELAGEKEKLRELEKQRDVRKEMQSLVKSGMNEHDALGLAEQKVSLTYKIEDKREREKKEKEDSRARAQEISDAFKTRFDAVQQTLSSVSRVGSGFGSLFPLVGKEGAGLSAAVDSLTGEVKKSNEYLRTIAEKAEKGGVALFS
ncbi:tape measure protein [uncultured Akkermansia sp.]|uniref:tape measure protein n=1 Tax=uncultured Akkermansia sp. TaxID=512294 RepID=UPI002611D962|nr:tape measure protein [uncultured Akkermansia sp.]